MNRGIGVVCILAVILIGAQAAVAPCANATDWLQFGFDPAHSGVNPAETGIAAQISNFHLAYSAQLPSLVDGAPDFLENVSTAGGTRDMLFISSAFGQIFAVDASNGELVWMQQPASGPAVITGSSPAIDPGRLYVYSVGFDGKVHKYNVGDGSEIVDGGWPETVTVKPDVEKITSALSFATAADGHTYLYATTSNYAYDKGDYQGHVTAIDLASGEQAVFNTVCSDTPGHLAEAPAVPDCADTQAGIWSRPGVIYDAANDSLYLASGNGPYTANAGGHDWGESVMALSPSLRDADGNELSAPLDSYTPSEYASLNTNDWDLGVEAPAILPTPAGSKVRNLGVQIGKDGILRLLNLDDLSGRGGAGHVGGEIAKVTNVDFRGSLNTQPAVWTDPATGVSWLFAVYATAEYAFFVSTDPQGNPQLVGAWSRVTGGGTSPVVADGVLFVIEPANNALVALDAKTGTEFWSTPVNDVHWASPIVVNEMVYLVDGEGVLRAYAASPVQFSVSHALVSPGPKPKVPVYRPPASENMGRQETN